MQEHKEECDRVVLNCWSIEARDGRIDDIKRLLKRGIKVDRTTEVSRVKGYTALSYPTFVGKNEIVKFLLQSVTDVDKVLCNGITPLYSASVEVKLEVVKYLVEEDKAEVDKVTNDGWTPLKSAKSKGHEEVVKYLKGKGAKDQGGGGIEHGSRLRILKAFCFYFCTHLPQLQEHRGH